VADRYPQLVIEKFDMYDQTPLALWLAERAGRTNPSAPAIFIGEDALIGEAEITPQNLEALVERYTSTGAEKVWESFRCEAEQNDVAEWVRSLGPLAVALTGLWDGVNPCAIATLIFFVSYLTLSGRKGPEVLAVGAAFTLGVFLAYLAIGVGFYKVLGMVEHLLTAVRRWVHGLTALLCISLAVFSFLDYLKARRGQIGDMSLNLPHSLRMRINAIIRRGRRARTYVAWAFVTGVAVSLLELACTGQTYAPIVFCVVSVPELRARAASYLVLYNLMFILPLAVIFVLVYYGVTAQQLTQFLQRHAAAVKLGMVVVFASLAALMLLTL
jgi:cytochrome c biogenesis protein CcdA